MKLAGHVTRTEQTINVYRILVATSEGQKPLGRPRSKWDDNIIMDLKLWIRLIMIRAGNWPL
jgi:hypothetical protein